jgi:hypothetical protein
MPFSRFKILNQPLESSTCYGQSDAGSVLAANYRLRGRYYADDN